MRDRILRRRSANISVEIDEVQVSVLISGGHIEEEPSVHRGMVNIRVELKCKHQL